MKYVKMSFWGNKLYSTDVTKGIFLYSFHFWHQTYWSSNPISPGAPLNTEMLDYTWVHLRNCLLSIVEEQCKDQLVWVSNQTGQSFAPRADAISTVWKQPLVFAWGIQCELCLQGQRWVPLSSSPHSDTGNALPRPGKAECWVYYHITRLTSLQRRDDWGKLLVLACLLMQKSDTSDHTLILLVILRNFWSHVQW